MRHTKTINMKYINIDVKYIYPIMDYIYQALVHNTLSYLMY